MVIFEVGLLPTGCRASADFDDLRGIGVLVRVLIEDSTLELLDHLVVPVDRAFVSLVHSLFFLIINRDEFMNLKISV